MGRVVVVSRRERTVAIETWSWEGSGGRKSIVVRVVGSSVVVQGVVEVGRRRTVAASVVVRARRGERRSVAVVSVPSVRTTSAADRTRSRQRTVSEGRSVSSYGRERRLRGRRRSVSEGRRGASLGGSGRARRNRTSFDRDDDVGAVLRPVTRFSALEARSRLGRELGSLSSAFRVLDFDPGREETR